MLSLKLNEEWNGLMTQYKLDHQDSRNQFCHKIGIPMILASLPIGATVIGLPIAVPLFTAGWGFQFIGHAFEGKKPSFANDRRNLVIGALWWAQKTRLVKLTQAPKGA